MKKHALCLLIFICIFCICACTPDEGLSAAFDLEQYDQIIATTTISKNAGVILDETTTVTRLEEGGYKEVVSKKSLAPIDSDTKYVETTTEKTYAEQSYEAKLAIDLSRLTVPQLSSVIAVDGVRRLELFLTAEEVAVLFDKDDVDDGKEDFKLTITFDEKVDVMTSLETSYKSQRGNNVTLSVTFAKEA